MKGPKPSSYARMSEPSSDVAALIDKTVDAYGRLDCAVNNAGVVRFTPLVEETAAGFDFHLHTNLRGVFYCMKHEIRQMLKNGGGAIVNQSSITGSLTGNPGEFGLRRDKGRRGRSHQVRGARSRQAQHQH